MKAATVEELHNQQAEVLGWVRAGEEVAISQQGIVIARLVPEKKDPSDVPPASENGSKPNARPTYLRDRSGERVLSTEEVAIVLDENKGSW